MTLRLAILGDSIAYGVGATRPDDAVGPRLAASLSAAGTIAISRIYAVPGAVSSGLSRQVEDALGWQPDIALIIIGANDLTRLVPPARAAELLADAVRRLRAASVQVVVAPAPDLSVLPQVPQMFRELVRAGSGMLREAQTRVTIIEGGRVADTSTSTAPAFASTPALFSRDRFHPSSEGYALIVRVLWPAVQAAARDVVAEAG